MKKYEVQEFNLCGGWTNNWSFECDNGITYPSVFNSFEEAEIELNCFLADCEDDVIEGNMEDAPDREDFRIVEVQDE